MGSSNFHTPWADTLTVFEDTSMDLAPSQLDQAITFMKNVIVSCDGIIGYNKTTGVLSWSGTLRFLFTNSSGHATLNTCAAGNVTLTDGKFAYVDLSETTDATIVVYAATLTTGASTDSNFVAYNRVVLAYRNSTSDDLCPVNLYPNLNDPDKTVQTLTDADTVTVDWSKGSTAEITLDRASTTFAFMNSYNGQRCLLIIKQYSGPGSITFGSEVRGGTSSTLPVSLSLTAGKKDFIGFVYGSTDAKWDYLSMDKGH